MFSTQFTELVGCSVPIQQAGMGSHSTPELAAAVANAGGLGMVSLYGIYGGPPENIARKLDSAKAQTTGAIGANFIMLHMNPDWARDAVKMAAVHADVVEFFYTDPDPDLVDIVHGQDALACWQIGSRDEAIAAVNAGCDFIIAQGIEAGGHVRGTIGLLALLDQVLDAVNVPVVAAGGVGSGRAMAAVLTAGADGVRVGTRFLATEEAEAHPQYLEALINSEAQDTIYTRAFNADWKAPARMLRSPIEVAEASDDEFVASMADTWNDERYQLKRFECSALHKSAIGHIEAMAHLAGESVGSVKKAQTVAEIISELTSEAEKLLKRWH
jgi:NAD(P)H-dependent flavin oxidoreductase YrpB (nitropropane dioxygenase family)